MIVTGIMLMLILVMYTDPDSLREFIREKYKSARLLFDVPNHFESVLLF
jgi:hypothetical protein